MSTEEKSLVRTMKKANIPIRNMIAILSYIRGGRTALTYDTKDVANYSLKVGRERTVNDMKKGIVQRLMEYVLQHSNLPIRNESLHHNVKMKQFINGQ